MSRLIFQQFAALGSEHFELYWLAGLTRNDGNAWYVRAVLRGMSSHRFHVHLLPIGVLPLLTLGKVFADCEPLSLSARGMISTATIPDVSQHEEITSADIPPELYSFGDKRGGIQRLFRYRTDQGEILIPAIELIRYLFLHNRTLANALMRPGALNLMFHPEAPGYRPELILRFTPDVPKSCLSHQFAQEFAWIALDPNARRAWDSIYLQSHGQQYVTCTPPALKNSVWTFNGVQYGNRWLVLELLHLTGKQHPCDKLHYAHPSLKQVVRDSGGGKNSSDRGGDNVKPLHDHIVYDYQLDDGHAGNKSSNSQTATDVRSKRSDFDRKIEVKKLLIEVNKAPGMQQTTSVSLGLRAEKRQTVKVSVGEQGHTADLPVLDFKLLTPARWDCLGDLESLTKTLQYMVARLPKARFAMSLCQIKTGRVFSMANRKPRVALVAIITLQDVPPIVLLDVERTGNVALSLIALRFRHLVSFTILEASVKQMLDGLVEASGHWDHEVERALKDVCTCERLPKMLTPRENAGLQGQATMWALKLMHKLGLGGGTQQN